MKTCHTAEIAALIGVHPNTIRFYEEQGFLSKVPRLKNGYRIYSDHHLLQLRFIRLAFKAEIISDNLRSEVAQIIKTAATGQYEAAISQTNQYRQHIEEEVSKALEAIRMTEGILLGQPENETDSITIGRREAAAQLGITMDVLRDWERNGLITIPRSGNRRQYGSAEMNCLKIIAILRHAHYSQMSIRRMLVKLEHGNTDVRTAIDTPSDIEDIVTAADRYITSLASALDDTKGMLHLLCEMQKDNHPSSIPPL